MPLPNSSVIQLNFQYEVNDEECVNTFYYGNTGPTLPCPVGALVTKFETAFKTKFMAMWANGASVKGYDAYPVEITSGPPSKKFVAGDIGTAAGDCMPSNVCLLFEGLQSELSQRVRRKWYVSGLPEGHNKDGFWDFAIYGVLYTLFGTQLATPLAATGGESPAIPCIRHRLNPGTTPAAYSFIPITGWRVSVLPAHQRRRTIYQTRAVPDGAALPLPPLDPPDALDPIVEVGADPT
jgi:hypothetical protein